jgi:uncharacterized repeat protein (TIGR03803 family)
MQTGNACVVSTAIVFLSVFSAAGQTSPEFGTLYNFTTQVGPLPSGPIGGVIIGPHGVLYGTTTDGGTNGSDGGTAYELVPPSAAGDPWTMHILYSFGAAEDGVRPIAGLALGAHGELYGTTSNGGSAEYGTVYELMPPADGSTEWTESVIYTFQGGHDGANPYAPVTVGPDGALYGTTYSGGYTGAGSGGCIGVGCGTVFKLSPPVTAGGQWTKTILHNFTGSDGTGNQPLDGEEPLDAVTFGKHGELYGTASGGAYQIYDCPFVCGVVFELEPPADAASDAPWTESILHAFTGPPDDGSVPFASVAFGPDGSIYGSTYWGGNSDYCFYGCGTIFQLKPPAADGGTWTESIIHNFAGPTADGNTPIAGLTIAGDGRMYGSTTSGGAAPTCATAPGQFDCGTIFELTPPSQDGGEWTETILHNFTGQFGDGDGSDPHATLVQDKDGVLFGTTIGGGTNGWGTTFVLKP